MKGRLDWRRVLCGVGGEVQGTKSRIYRNGVSKHDFNV